MVDRVMVLWSGGVESTSLIKHLLSETDAEVVAHHIRMTNPERREAKETEAISYLQPKLEAIRPFRVVFSDISVCSGEAHPMDYEVQYPIGLLGMRHERCTKLFRAGCLEDDWDHSQDNKGTWKLERPSPEPGFSHRRRAETLRPLLNGLEPAEIAPYLPWYTRPKAFHVRYLGDLLPYTWSCRRPQGLHACGRCHACLERHFAIAGASWIEEINGTSTT